MIMGVSKELTDHGSKGELSDKSRELKAPRAQANFPPLTQQSISKTAP